MNHADGDEARSTAEAVARRSYGKLGRLSRRTHHTTWLLPRTRSRSLRCGTGRLAAKWLPGKSLKRGC